MEERLMRQETTSVSGRREYRLSAAMIQEMWKQRYSARPEIRQVMRSFWMKNLLFPKEVEENNSTQVRLSKYF